MIFLLTVITWSSVGSPGAYVKIELLKAGVLNRVIVANTANDGSYSWVARAQRRRKKESRKP